MPNYYESLTVGDTETFGERTITREEIITFAEQYDPQPFHTDEEAAEQSLFGGLVASGWHTAAVCMRLFVDHAADDAWLGARGIDELRWIDPVRPGDTLSVTTEIVDKRPSGSDPTLGHVDSKLTATNQHDDPVLSWIGLAIVRRDPDRA